MNYIHKLQHDNRMKAAEIEGLRDTIQSLRKYLASPKFHTETWVDVKDIFNRLDAGEQLIRETPR